MEERPSSYGEYYMRDLYYRDGEKLFKTFSCKHCGGDKLVVNKKPVSKVEELVKLDIAYIMPIETLRPDDGITYECQCKNSAEYAFVDKEIPAWVSKEVYNIDGCKSCGSPSGVIIREDGNSTLKLDQAEDFELYCPFCEAVENVANLKKGKELEVIFESPIEVAVNVVEVEHLKSEDKDNAEEIDESTLKVEDGLVEEVEVEEEEVEDTNLIQIDDEDLIIFDDEDDFAGTETKEEIEVEETTLDSISEEDEDDFIIEL